MNVPFHFIYVTIYEMLKEKLIPFSKNKEYDVRTHILAGIDRNELIFKLLFIVLFHIASSHQIFQKVEKIRT
jgi:hypothetical protein